MLTRIIRFATSRPKSVIALWTVIAIGLGGVVPLMSYDVTTDDTARFLPKSSESAQATRYAQTAFGAESGTSTVTVLIERSDRGRLTARDREHVAQLSAAMPQWRPDIGALKRRAKREHPDRGEPITINGQERAGRIVTAAVGPVANRERFQLVALQWKANASDPLAQEAFRDFRDRTAARARTARLRVAFTGGIASVADRSEADESRQALQGGLLLGAVVLLSLLFFRGPLAAFLPLLTVALVATAASGLIVLAAAALDFKLDVSTPQLITVVLVGVGVDYFLFLLFRLRERLRAGEDRRTAARHAAERVGPVIASAALAVVVAFATLGLAQFGQFRVLGPSIAISVLVMLLAGVTLMPAVAAVTGRAMFWPSTSWRRENLDGPAGRFGRTIARRPGRVALALLAGLLALATVAFATRMDYDASSGGPDTAATRTADRIAAAMPRGATDPQQVYLRSRRPLSPHDLEPLRRALTRVQGVSSVAAAALTHDRTGARVDVVLDASSTTKTATDIARGPLRDAAHRAAPAGTTAMVGGRAAIFADVSDSVIRDLRLIFPVAAGLILLILVVALRSAVAPLYLLAAVALEFAATLGAAVLVFQQLAGEPGVAFTMPLVLFLFVVALGTDYNILMTARLREEMLAGVPVRRAVAEAVRHVAPAIAAAGLVLSASFATLMLASDSGTRQMGFAMAFGILLAAFAVSSTFVPAITAIAGQSAWWPGRSARTRSAAPAQPHPGEDPALQPA
jgi:RND superfamily putative drug exporter